MGRTRFLGVLAILTALSAPVRAAGAVLPPGQSVTLAWNPSPDSGVAGYRIYYGVGSRTYTNMVDTGTATNATIANLVAGATYYFAATSYNLLGLESDYSTEASYAVSAALAKVQIRAAPSRQVVLTVTGQTGHTYQVLATQDLKTWTVIGVVTVGAGGSADFTDSNAASFPRRFYRTQE
jgi:hypothetical protein